MSQLDEKLSLMSAQFVNAAQSKCHCTVLKWKDCTGHHSLFSVSFHVAVFLFHDQLFFGLLAKYISIERERERFYCLLNLSESTCGKFLNNLYAAVELQGTGKYSHVFWTARQFGQSSFFHGWMEVKRPLSILWFLMSCYVSWPSDAF